MGYQSMSADDKAFIQEGFFVSYKRKYVHKVLVNRLFKHAQEKVRLGVNWDVKQQNKQKDDKADTNEQIQLFPILFDSFSSK